MYTLLHQFFFYNKAFEIFHAFVLQTELHWLYAPNGFYHYIDSAPGPNCDSAEGKRPKFDFKKERQKSSRSAAFHPSSYVSIVLDVIFTKL